jgi:hypothetical protein
MESQSTREKPVLHVAGERRGKDIKGATSGPTVMLEFCSRTFVNLLEAYALLGFVFAGFFVSLGVQKLDSEAKDSGIAFRLVILPGVAAFWPMLLARCLRGIVEPPDEKNPHRIP